MYFFYLRFFSLTQGLYTNVLSTFQMFGYLPAIFLLLISSLTLLGEEHIWKNTFDPFGGRTHFFKFDEVCFVAQDMVYVGICFKNTYSAVRWNKSINTHYVLLLDSNVKFLLVIFQQGVLLIVNQIVKSPNLFVNISIPFNSSIFASYTVHI